MFEGKTFKIRYIGSRFDGGRLPLEVLSDLSAFRELLLTFAKERWRKSNAGRRRLPRGFDQSFTYDLIGISNGSAVAQLDSRPRPGQESLPGFSQFEEIATGSYNEVLAHIDFASNQQSPPALTSEQAAAFNRFGSALNDDERIEFEGSRGSDGNIIFLDTHRRKNLITRGGHRYQLRINGIGDLAGLHRKGHIAVQTHKYGEIKIPIEPGRVKDEFCVRENLGAPVQFSLLIELDAKDRSKKARYKSVKQVYEVELIDQERSDSVMKCIQRMTELRQLENGWLDGSGLRPTDAAIGAAELFLNKRPDLASSFRIYPMENGGVAFEFELRGWEFSIEFGPDGRVEMFGVEINGPDEMEPKTFDRVDELFLAEFDSRATG